MRTQTVTISAADQSVISLQELLLEKFDYVDRFTVHETSWVFLRNHRTKTDVAYAPATGEAMLEIAGREPVFTVNAAELLSRLVKISL